MIANNERLTVSIKEAAVMLGISKNLAYSLARRGELPGAVKLGQKRMVVSRVQLERFLAGNSEAKNG
jgi:excisionase family DNA binding protein